MQAVSQLERSLPRRPWACLPRPRSWQPCAFAPSLCNTCRSLHLHHLFPRAHLPLQSAATAGPLHLPAAGTRSPVPPDDAKQVPSTLQHRRPTQHPAAHAGPCTAQSRHCAAAAPPAPAICARLALPRPGVPTGRAPPASPAARPRCPGPTSLIAGGGGGEGINYLNPVFTADPRKGTAGSPLPRPPSWPPSLGEGAGRRQLGPCQKVLSRGAALSSM